MHSLRTFSLSRSAEDFNHGFSSRPRFYGAMAAKRLKGLYFANIAAATAELNGPTVDRYGGPDHGIHIPAAGKDL
ncbi:unnamed protein product [Macrosiphum euphorbiae]|uniref:Uncharacterized protein n=1 Tax=Macrosiphum euphorbiae TaxID=13131 RepID=A0AAV0X7M5_9HEMI|nr:unnamed protein product [Macrosiphum euphorbiae]